MVVEQGIPVSRTKQRIARTVLMGSRVMVTAREQSDPSGGRSERAGAVMERHLASRPFWWRWTRGRTRLLRIMGDLLDFSPLPDAQKDASVTATPFSFDLVIITAGG